jgi:hypothetical protein
VEQRTRVVPVQVDDGTEVMFVTTVPGREEDVAAFAATYSFRRVAESISALSKSLRATIDSAHPDRATVEFGVELSVEASELLALVVQGSAAGNIRVTLEWSLSRPDQA